MGIVERFYRSCSKTAELMEAGGSAVFVISGAVSKMTRGIYGCLLKNTDFTGAGGQNRTADTVIFSHLLYRLSYPGANCD